MNNLRANEMTDSELYKAAHMMDAMGGGFAAAIAEAFFRADSDNKQRIVSAFPELFERYAPTEKDYE